MLGRSHFHKSFSWATFVIYLHMYNLICTLLAMTRITSNAGPCTILLIHEEYKLCENSVGWWVTKGSPPSLAGIEINICSWGQGWLGNTTFVLNPCQRLTARTHRHGRSNLTFTDMLGCRHICPGLLHHHKGSEALPPTPGAMSSVHLTPVRRFDLNTKSNISGVSLRMYCHCPWERSLIKGLFW